MSMDKKDSIGISVGAPDCHCGRRAVVFKLVSGSGDSASFVTSWRFLCGRQTCEAEAVKLASLPVKPLAPLPPARLERP